MTSEGARSFLIAFVIGTIVGMTPVAALTVRLAMLGEVGFPNVTRGEARLHLRSYDVDQAFQFRQTERLGPELLVLGSSRALSTRRFFFPGCTSAECFYNAGIGMRTIAEGLAFVRELGKSRAPDVMLLALDHWQFNPAYQKELAHRVPDLRPGPLVTSGLYFTKAIIPRLRDEPQLRALFLGRVAEAPDTEGIEARLHERGHREDGSMYWGVPRVADSRRDREQLVGIIAQGLSRFPPFDDPDLRSLDELDALVALAEENGTRIVAYMPPYGDEIWAAIQADPRLRAGFAAVEEAVSRIFSSRGVPLLITHRFTDLGCGDDELWDGLHTTEVCDARLYQRLLREPGAGTLLARFTSSEWLRALVDGARSPHYLRGAD